MSTKAELLAINDFMAQDLWTRHIHVVQGVYVSTTKNYQDNKITILLARNGRTSGSMTARHLDIPYFFSTDKIKKEKSK